MNPNIEKELNQSIEEFTKLCQAQLSHETKLTETKGNNLVFNTVHQFREYLKIALQNETPTEQICQKVSELFKSFETEASRSRFSSSAKEKIGDTLRIVRKNFNQKINGDQPTETFSQSPKQSEPISDPNIDRKTLKVFKLLIQQGNFQILNAQEFGLENDRYRLNLPVDGTLPSEIKQYLGNLSAETISDLEMLGAEEDELINILYNSLMAIEANKTVAIESENKLHNFKNAFHKIIAGNDKCTIRNALDSFSHNLKSQFSNLQLIEKTTDKFYQIAKSELAKLIEHPDLKPKSQEITHVFEVTFK